MNNIFEYLYLRTSDTHDMDFGISMCGARYKGAVHWRGGCCWPISMYTLISAHDTNRSLSHTPLWPDPGTYGAKPASSGSLLRPSGQVIVWPLHNQQNGPDGHEAQ